MKHSANLNEEKASSFLQSGILILDFGSQFTQLIARRLRELHVYCEIHSWKTPLEQVAKWSPKGVILSGGPNSVYDSGAPTYHVQALEKISPLLGVCYGMQLMAQQLGGRVQSASKKEYGLQKLRWEISTENKPTTHLSGYLSKVWMSHGDIVSEVPPSFSVWAKSDTDHIAVMASERSVAVQFHPEVAHTENGMELLKYFVFQRCGILPLWKPEHFFNEIKNQVLSQVPSDEHVLMGLSGGVDSSVVATFLTQILGADRVHCVFVDNGLLRKNEYDSVLQAYTKLGLNVKGIDARHEFLSALSGVTDPEEKRKTIGRVFIEVFEKSYDRNWPVKWLGQGTLYPDVIESVSSVGGSVTIKSHHNVGGLPSRMNLKLLEPVRQLFKDEVRALGAQLGLPHEILWRHPFPGPGLAIRVLGEVTEEKLQILKDCDEIFVSELKAHGLYDQIWQAFCVLLPVRTVGVQGDARTYSHVLALRAVTASDGMTADWFHFDGQFLQQLSNRITNAVKGVNRVVYDITSKPPGTIEWE